MDRQLRGCIHAISFGLALGAALLATLPARAADGQDIQVGLWEMTMTTTRSGVPALPPSVLAKMSPEQRARVQSQAKKEAAAGPQTGVYKTCVTTQDLKDGAFRADAEDEDEDCTQKVVSQTKTLQQATLSCGGESPRNTTMRVEARDREHVKGSIEGSAGQSPFTAQINARWRGADIPADRTSPLRRSP
jgi:hypothetical protein